MGVFIGGCGMVGTDVGMCVRCVAQACGYRMYCKGCDISLLSEIFRCRRSISFYWCFFTALLYDSYV